MIREAASHASSSLMSGGMQVSRSIKNNLQVGSSFILDSLGQTLKNEEQRRHCRLPRRKRRFHFQRQVGAKVVGSLHAYLN